MDYYSLFWGPVAISIVVELQGVLTCWSSTLTVLADSGPFHDYYSPFWGPEAISMVVEFQGALTCRSSTITVWADSGPFLGLLLYFGVSGSFPRLMNPGVRLRVDHQHSHIRLNRVHFVHYYSVFWGPRAISTIDEPRVRLCVGYQHSPFCPILVRLVDYH